MGNFFTSCTFKDNAGNTKDVLGTYTVNKADTSVSITNRSATSSQSGQGVTVSYGLSVVAPGGGTPTGNVTISDGVDSCTGTVAAGSCTINITTVGDRTLTASYAGETRYKSSTSVGMSHTVSKTGVSLDTYPGVAKAVAGEPIDVYTDLYNQFPGDGPFTGTVTYSDGVDSCVADVKDNGHCVITLRTVGDRTIGAAYSGDSRHEAGTSAMVVQISRARVDYLADSPSGWMPVVGQDMPITWLFQTQSPSTFTLPGTAPVTITDGVDSCTGTVASGGCTLRLTTPGERLVTWTFEDGPWWRGVTDSGIFLVSPASTTTTITGRSPAPSAVGQAVTVGYAVAVTAPGNGSPGGNVTVTDGVDSCTGTVAAGSCSLTLTTAGTRTLVATYAGSSRFTTSTSAGVSHKVKIGTTTGQVGSLSGPGAPGVPFAVAWTVTAADSSTPTGDVTVTWGTDTCTAAVAAGSCSITPTGVGTKAVTIAYAGDADRLGSSLAAGTKAVLYPFAWSGPKAPPLVNSAKAGAKVPIRFTLGAGYGKAILATGFPKVQAASCSTWATSGTNASTTPKPPTGLTYTASTRLYAYGWQTSATWFKGTPVCRVVTIKLIDGTSWKLRYRFASAQ